VCRRFGFTIVSPFWLSPVWFVAVIVCRRFDGTPLQLTRGGESAEQTDTTTTRRVDWYGIEYRHGQRRYQHISSGIPFMYQFYVGSCLWLFGWVPGL